ncbi:hypothetical protein [Cognatishimia sp. MH4019]|uniref:hypothetical protein n=1 Tax=Cognatishimia sp. MH4019 TaxID=2854030 RepID=UPI001CD55FB4|nr:hypothetical protein [Cognatishimia sp. MH4019]
MATSLNALGIGTAFVASIFWFLSAKVFLPKDAFVSKWDGDGSAERNWAEKSSRFNRLAALFSGVSALSFALGATAEILGA